MPDWLIPAAQAHEKWFVPVTYPAPPAPALFRTVNPTAISAVILVVVVFVVAALADRAYEKSRLYEAAERRIRPYRDYASIALGATMGISLLWSAFHGELLATNFSVGAGFASSLLCAAEGLIGLLMLVGLFAPAAAVGLIGLYAAAFVLFPAVEPIDYVNILGIGIFLLFFARGRYSLDWFLGKPILTSSNQRKWAYLALRVLTGFALFWLGLWKYIRPDLHFALMDKYPDFNPYVIAGWVGIHLTRELYVFVLAWVEMAIGFAVMMGWFTRLAAVFLVPIMLGSILFLGPWELVGHLPIIGTLFVLFIYGDTYHKHRDASRMPMVPKKNAA